MLLILLRRNQRTPRKRIPSLDVTGYSLRVKQTECVLSTAADDVTVTARSVSPCADTTRSRRSSKVGKGFCLAIAVSLHPPPYPDRLLPSTFSDLSCLSLLPSPSLMFVNLRYPFLPTFA